MRVVYKDYHLPETLLLIIPPRDDQRKGGGALSLAGVGDYSAAESKRLQMIRVGYTQEERGESRQQRVPSRAPKSIVTQISQV
jgi:hypothetical protein